MFARQSRRDPLEVERRELALDLVLEGEVERAGLPGLAVPQRGLRLPRVVVAVVAEEDDLAAELGLEPAGREDLGRKEPPREEPARLLAEADDRARLMPWPAPRPAPGPIAAWRTRLNAMQAAQPMTLYQRYEMLRLK